MIVVGNVKPIPFTQEGHDALEKEQEQLVTERKEAVMHLKRAREMGDLSENGYYKASRWKLSAIDRRIKEVANLLKRAVIIQKVATDHVEIGSTVTIANGTIEKIYTVVGGFESNPNEEKISHISPLGKALLGKKRGEIIVFQTPNGSKKYTLIKIS